MVKMIILNLKFKNYHIYSKQIENYQKFKWFYYEWYQNLKYIN
jgi:hypothetical protein